MFFEEVLASILAHVGSLGWDASCWTDDNLSSKKIYPGYQFPSKSKKWVARLKTTDESMSLFVQRVQTTHERKPEHMRKKLDSNSLDAISERAAALWHMGNNIQLATPLIATTVHSNWLSAWAQGSDHIDMELQALLLDNLCQMVALALVFWSNGHLR